MPPAKEIVEILGDVAHDAAARAVVDARVKLERELTREEVITLHAKLLVAVTAALAEAAR